MEAYPYLWRDMCYCVVPTTKTHGIGEKFAIVSSSCREKTTHNAICVLDMMRALEWERWLIVIVDGCNGDGCLYSYHVLPPPPLLLLYFIYTLNIMVRWQSNQSVLPFVPKCSVDKLIFVSTFFQEYFCKLSYWNVTCLRMNSKLTNGVFCCWKFTFLLWKFNFKLNNYKIFTIIRRVFKWNRHRCANTEGLRTTTNKQEGWIANSNWTDRHLPKHMSNEQRSMNQIGCWWKIDATNTRRGFTFDNPKNACTVAHLRTYIYTYTCIYSCIIRANGSNRFHFISCALFETKIASSQGKNKIKQNKNWN